MARKMVGSPLLRRFRLKTGPTAAAAASWSGVKSHFFECFWKSWICCCCNSHSPHVAVLFSYVCNTSRAGLQKCGCQNRADFVAESRVHAYNQRSTWLCISSDRNIVFVTAQSWSSTCNELIQIWGSFLNNILAWRNKDCCACAMFPKWVMVTIPILHHRGGSDGGSWDQPATFVCPPPPAPTRFSQANRSRISRFLSSHQPAGDLLYERRQEARVGGGGAEGSRIIPIQIETCDKTSSSDGMHRCRRKSASTRKIEIVIESQSNRRSDLPSSSSYSWERHHSRPTARSLSCGTVGASPFQPSKALFAWSIHNKIVITRPWLN